MLPFFLLCLVVFLTARYCLCCFVFSSCQFLCFLVFSTCCQCFPLHGQPCMATMGSGTASWSDLHFVRFFKENSKKQLLKKTIYTYTLFIKKKLWLICSVPTTACWFQIKLGLFPTYANCFDWFYCLVWCIQARELVKTSKPEWWLSSNPLIKGLTEPIFFVFLFCQCCAEVLLHN